MKKIMKIVILMAVFFEITMAANPPRATGDVVARNITVFDKLPRGWSIGHVGLHDTKGAYRRRILEVRTAYPAIHRASVRSMTHSGGYWGSHMA